MFPHSTILQWTGRLFLAGTVLISLSACFDPKTVFVTEAVHDGNLGGLVGADAICQAEADAAGLEGTYLAWLGTPTGAPALRFRNLFSGPFLLVDGTEIAVNWADLTDGLASPINLTAQGKEVSGYVWTGVWIDGHYASSQFSDWPWYPTDCDLWTNSNESGTYGDTGSTIWNWTLGYWCSTIGCGPYDTYCGEELRLYCFQQ